MAKLAAALTLFGVAGCGGGSSGTAGGGTLNFRPVWEQDGGAGSAAGGGAAGQPVQTTHGSFGPALPAAVKIVRVVFDSDAGQHCCLAVDPAGLPVDPATGRKFLVLDALASGSATVTLAGFATSFAPTAGNATDMCPTEPSGAGEPCDSSRVATPSFISDPQRVTIVQGAESNAGDIPVFAVPFLLRSTPAPNGSASAPVSLSFTLVDAATGVDQSSLAVNVSQAGGATSSPSLTVSACDDKTSPVCSTGGTLKVAGFLMTATAPNLSPGSAQVRVRARNLAATPRSLDFTYSFDVRSGTQGTTIIVRRTGQSIAEVARSAPAGATLIVPPGSYAPIKLRSGDLRGPLTLLADVTGKLTDSPPAAVVISVSGALPAIDLSDVSDVTIDGLTLRAAAGAGVLVNRGVRTTVRNCVVTGTRGNGIEINDSESGLIFDNLLSGSSGSGIAVTGGRGISIINNTVYGSQNSGIRVGSSADASSDVLIQNNIVDHNTPTGIDVAPAVAGYDGEFNLNTDGYAAGTPVGVNDIDADPLFITPQVGDFHLHRPESGPFSPAIDASDPLTDDQLVSALQARTTQSDGTPDAAPVDLGYHYPGPNPPVISGSQSGS